MREAIAEFAGVAVFVMIGAGADCQAVLSTNTKISSSPKGVSRESAHEKRLALYLNLNLF